MNLRLVLVALILASLSLVALGAAQDGDLPDPSDEVPDEVPDDVPGEEAPDQPDPDDPPSPQVDPDIVFDEVFVPLDQNTCPVQDGFDSEDLRGEMGWVSNEHPLASDQCVAQWGQGPWNQTRYQRGTKAALGSDGLPTRHLAASGEPSRVLNDAAQTLIDSGVDPRIAGPAISGMASGCVSDSILAGSMFGLDRPAVDLCRSLLTTSTVLLEPQEVPAGAGALYFELEHAFDFSDADENRIAPDGGWVEVRTPGEDWSRLDPVAMYAPSEDALGTLCTLSGPLAVAGDTYTGPRNLQFVSYEDGVRGLYDAATGDPPVAPFLESLGGGGEARDVWFSLFAPFTPHEREWQEECGALLQGTYGETYDIAQETDDEASEDAFAQTMNRFSPYPGVIRGEGAGFVGSTHDNAAHPSFITHWFDLAPYAGETVEVRLVATGGAGIGGQSGGWWVDEANLRYTGPADDLSVRVETPQDGDVLPTSVSEITPGGTLLVEAVVENLGRTDSRPSVVELSMEGASTNVTVPELEPLESHRVTAMLPAPIQDQAQVSAQITQTVNAQGQAQHAPYQDAYPANDDDAVAVTFDDVHETVLDITSVERDGAEANVTIRIDNQGNKPIVVPLKATLTPVDLMTRTPRAMDATQLGVVDVLFVPHGDDVNAYGVPDPTETTHTTVTLPQEGVWELTIAHLDDPSVEASTVLPLEEATPTALQNAFGSVVEGPTSEVPRGGFELVGHIPDVEDTPGGFVEDLRNAIEGPETRFMTTGDHAMASDGRDLPEEWKPAHADDVVGLTGDASASIGPDPDRGCGAHAEAETGQNLLDQWTHTDRQGVNELKDALCKIEDRQGIDLFDDLPGELASDLDVETPDGVGVPASMHAWHVRQHSVNIYGVGTDASETGAIDALTLQEDDERVYLTFDHAANLDWENERGAKAQILIVPGGQIDVVEEMRNAEELTRELTTQLGEELGLPPESRALLNTVLMDLFFENLIQVTPDTRFPQDVCEEGEALPAGVGSIVTGLCGDAQLLGQLDDVVDVAELDFADQAESTYLHESGKRSAEEGSGIVRAWEDPIPWGSERVDITRVVENTTSDDGVHEGFYVMFDLVTTTDADTFLATAGADLGGDEDDRTMVRHNDDERSVEGANATYGWGQGPPLWTVNEPRLDRVNENDGSDEPIASRCLSVHHDDPESPCTPTNTIDPVDTRGWYQLPLEATAKPAWSYEQRGGDPNSGAPGALVWQGGTGHVIETFDGPRIAIDQDDPDPYGVLRSPVVDLSGYDVPVVEMNVQWGRTNVSPIETTFPDDADGETVADRCKNAEDVPEGVVYTPAGWNVRVTPIQPDGSLGETQTVEPLDGYDGCNPEGDVPILFYGKAIHRSPQSYGVRHDWTTSSPADTLTQYDIPDHSTTASDCQPSSQELLDPMRYCRPATVAFGHDEPVFAKPMTGWNDVALDLSPFRGEKVMIEVHAFGVTGDDESLGIGQGEPLGELRIDAFEVSEGEPPFDVRASHEQRTIIPPSAENRDVEERFEVEIENRGALPVETVDIRRTVIGPDGCQAVDPVVESWMLFDPATGQPGLPPGGVDTITNPRLTWVIPRETGEVYERILTVETGPGLEASLAPQVSLAADADGNVKALVTDEDDCADGYDVLVEELYGDADVDEDGNEVLVQHGDEDVGETVKTVKVQGVDRHGVEGLPAYITPLPPIAPQPAFTVTCDGLSCTFNASKTQDPQDRVETYEWDFDHGKPGDKKVQDHTYDEEGRYEVTLTITYGEDDDGDPLESSTSEVIRVTENPPEPDAGDPMTVFESAGHELNQIRDFVFPPPDDEAEDVLRNGSVEVNVLHSAKDDAGTGSQVLVDIGLPEHGSDIELLLPCERGQGCHDNHIQVEDQTEIVLEGLSPGHYLGYVLFGEDAFAPVEFIIEQDPETGQDARPSSNTVTLRSEIQEEASLQVTDIDVRSPLPTGEVVDLPIKITNVGNVRLKDVTAEISIQSSKDVEPDETIATVEADRIPLLKPGETLTTQGNVTLTRPGPATIVVKAQSEGGEDTTPVTDRQASGLVIVDREIVDAEPGVYDHWQVAETLQFGDGVRVPAGVNTVLPLTGLMDTASSPFSLFEMNVSVENGGLEQAYDGISIEWRPADAELNDRGELVDEDPIVSQTYGGPGYTFESLFNGDLDEQSDNLQVECDPIIDTKDITKDIPNKTLVPFSELSNPETYACRGMPVSEQITSSHEGGIPGETRASLSGDATLGLSDAQIVLTAASDLPGTQARVVDTVTSEDWLDDSSFGGFTMGTGTNAFWMPTATLIGESAQAYTHEIRVPLNVGQWCQLTEDIVPERTPFRVITEERRLFSDAWDVNVRFETGSMGSMSDRIVTGEPIVTLQDATTTDWRSIEYDIPLGPLDAVAAASAFSGTLGDSAEDSCEGLHEEAPELEDKRPSNAEIVFELTTEDRSVEEALEVGWFLSTIKVPELGIDIGAGDGNYATTRCKGGLSESTYEEGVIRGCTWLATAGLPIAGSMHDDDDLERLEAEDWLSSANQRVQSVDVDSDAVDAIPVLDALLSERSFDIGASTSLYDDGRDVLRTQGNMKMHDGDAEDWFRYVDAVALVDLRAGLEGQLTFDVDATEGSDVVAQIVAAPIDPEKASHEEAPARASWTPLDFCEDRPGEKSRSVSSSYPDVPLGATRTSIVGPVEGSHTLLTDDVLEAFGSEDDHKLCADVSLVGGEVAMIGVRLWMPTPDSEVEIGEGTVRMNVAQPQQLKPQLRVMTDDTVHEGTIIIHDVSLLTMPPRFAHEADVSFDDPTEWRLNPDDEDPVELFESNSTPSLTIRVDEPAMQSRWDIQAHLTVETISGTHQGEIDLPESTYEGSQEIHVPWQNLRESIAWLEGEPVLPSGEDAVERMSVDVRTTPETLLNPVSGCPASLESLGVHEDIECRQLAMIIAEGGIADDSIITERALGEPAGIETLEVTPDRGATGTPRTVELRLANPTSLPRSLDGALTVQEPDNGLPWWATNHEGETLHEIDLPEERLDPWERTTITVDLPPLSEPVERVLVEGEVGDSTMWDDFRTSTRHEATLITPNWFTWDNRVERTPDATKPALPGHESDGSGWRIQTQGSMRAVTSLSTNAIWADDLQSVLQEDEDALFVFDHQRDLQGDADTDNGEYSYLTVALCAGNPQFQGSSSCTLLEDAWGPQPATPISEHTQTENQQGANGEQPPEYFACTQESQDTPDGNLAQYGIERGSRVIEGSTGSIQPDAMSAWETAAFTFTPSDIEETGSSTVHFRIMLGECAPDEGSEMIVDNVGLGSARPVLDIGADEVPIWPGSEKAYRFTLKNHGSGSDDVFITPSTSVPEGWHVSVEIDDEAVYDTRSGHLEPVPLAQGESKDGVARVHAPGTAQGGSEKLSFTAHSTQAPALRSSGALRAATDASIPTGDASVANLEPAALDPGNLVLRPVRADVPNLVVDRETVTIESAEIGTEATVQAQISNEGFQRAEDAPIAAAVRGPSGAHILQSPDGASYARETLDPGTTATLTWTWRPSAPGDHTLRIVADPDPEDLALLVNDEIETFFGQVQERQECIPGEGCVNIVDHPFTVAPLQQPDLRVTLEGVPDRISIGDETPLTVTIKNLGGQAAEDATLMLSDHNMVPIFDTMRVDLDPIEPGEATSLTTTWIPVSPGERQIQASVDAPDLFTGERGDGSNARADSRVTHTVTVDIAGVSVDLDTTPRPQPGIGHTVQATFTNEGTAPIEVLPNAVDEDGVYLMPVTNGPLTLGPGDHVVIPLLAFAEMGTPPTSKELPIPLSEGDATATVHVTRAPDADVTLDKTPLDPGTTDATAHVVNRGNVPLDGELLVRASGISGAVDLDLEPGASTNVTVPITVRSNAQPGTTLVATHVTTTSDERVTQHDRVTIGSAPAIEFRLHADRVPLAGSAQGELAIRNMGNEPLEGRAVLEGPVSLDASPALALAPGESQRLPVTWLSGGDRNGTAYVETLEGDTLASTTLVPSDVEPRLEIWDVQTRPAVNLVEGMLIEVMATMENTGNVTLTNHTIGLTLDGELYQTDEITDLRPGEVTTKSVPIEIPRSGELTVGLVDLSAFQRGESAGAAMTLEAGESALGLSMLEVPAPPWITAVLALALAAGGRRR